MYDTLADALLASTTLRRETGGWCPPVGQLINWKAPWCKSEEEMHRIGAWNPPKRQAAVLKISSLLLMPSSMKMQM